MALFTEVNTWQDFSVAAREENPLISQMSFIHKPQVGRDMFDVNPLETDIGEMFKMGLMEEVKGEEIIHHEANKKIDTPYINQSATLASVYGVASEVNGDPVLYVGLDYIQLATVSHSPTSGALAGTKSYPRVGQLIQFKNKGVWRISGKRISVANAHRLYITPLATAPALSATITLAATIYGGDQFSVMGSAFEEASHNMQTGLVPTSKTFTNYLQLFSEYYDQTDFESSNETYPFIYQGKPINFVYPRGFSDTEERMALLETAGLFLTPYDAEIPGFDKNGGAVTISTTQGYMPNLELNAPKLYYDNNPTVALFEQIIRLRRKLYQGRECLMQCGYEFLLKAKDIVTQFGVNGGMTYNRADLDLNIDKVKMGGGFVFNMKELTILNHPAITALPGFNYPWYFIIAPMDKTKDAKTGIMKDAFTIMWKKQQGGGARGHYKMWVTGADADVPTDDQNVKRIHIRSRKGVRVVAASKFILGQRLQA